MEPTTAALIAKAAANVLTDKRAWTGIASVIVAVCLPVILAVVCMIGIAAGGANHNVQAVKYSFHGGSLGEKTPEDYRVYIGQMRGSFEHLDVILTEVNEMTEGEEVDDYLVKSVFYSLFFGAEKLQISEEEYRKFIGCFVHYEERTKVVMNEDGEEETVTYTVTVPVTDKVEIYQKLKEDARITATYEDQSNAVNVWYQAKYGKSPPLEGDGFVDWGSWSATENITVYDLAASEYGGKIVDSAMSRLGNPYSQAYRGKGSYVDCSYLTMWCYRQAGAILPGTAAEQARYCVENKYTIAKAQLQTGDLVFWSYKPNGRFMNVTHVGIYAGDGMVVDASSSKGKVVYRNLFDSDKQVLYGRPQ